MNPWQSQHSQDEVAYHDDPRTAEALVANEYRDAPKAFPHTGCIYDNGIFYYKATIGAMKCTGCGALAWEDGDLI